VNVSQNKIGFHYARSNMRSIKVKNYSIVAIACLSFFALAIPIKASETNRTANSSPPKDQFVDEMYPGLTTGALTFAREARLPEGTLLKAGNLVINGKYLNQEIAGADEKMQPALRKNSFFVLEQMATFSLLLAEAKAAAAKSGDDISQKTEQAIIQDHLRSLIKTLEVTNEEITIFYNGNTEMFGDATLAQVKPQIEQFLLQQKQQELVNERIRTIGRRMPIEISAPWLKAQAALAKDNPVDKARDSGRASLIDFGSTGCVPCKMMEPILETLSKKYKDKINVLFINVTEEPILASRYGVQSIPVQIFFDKAGREFFRHVGFFPQEQIETKISEMENK
jgi:thiol-disulfide isomerase/thioredoxin